MGLPPRLRKRGRPTRRLPASPNPGEDPLEHLYFDQPYEFVPPHRGRNWCRIVQHLLPWVLRSQYGIDRWEYRDADRLRDAVREGVGVLIVANHCRLADSPVLGKLGVDQSSFFYYFASHHLFRGSKLERWKLRRMGAFSVFREGTDREAIREATRILSTGERPLVLYPEGTYARWNDRLLPLQEGLSLLVRRATKQSGRPVLVVPVALTYWCLARIEQELTSRLSQYEQALRWPEARDLPPLHRLQRLASAFLAAKEVEYLGEPVAGRSLQERALTLRETLLEDLEATHLGKVTTAHTLTRVRELLRVLIRRLQSAETPPEEKYRIRRELERVAFAQELFAHDYDYIEASPTWERLAEEVMRCDEYLHGREVLVGRAGVVGQVGEPIRVEHDPAVRTGSQDPLLGEVRTCLATMLEHSRTTGPPSAWPLPDPIAREAAVPAELAAAPVSGLAR